MGFFDKFKISNIKQEVTKELLSAKQEVVQKFSDTTQKAEQQISSMINPVQKSRPISSAPKNYNLPIGISNTLTSTNPYLSKYRNNCKEDAVYLLYCDYSSAYRWIQDTSKPDVFFKNYITAIQILKAIINRDSKDVKAKQQLNSLKSNYSQNVNFFITRFWNTTLEAAQKLKTEKGKQNKFQKFFDTLLVEYAEYLTAENVAFINTFRNKSINEAPLVIKQPVECGNYDVSTIESIERIPYNSFDAIRPLQKAATAHKRNGDIDLAIACLRKSNEISDRAQKADKLMEKEYLRILSYIALLEQPELIKAEEDRIKQIHPEFWDKRVSNRERIQEMISQNKDWNEDLILISTRSSCTICGHYHNRVYSISGKHRIYPKIPVEALNQTHECKNCSWSASLFIEGITTLKPITKEEMAEMDRRERIKNKTK